MYGIVYRVTHESSGRVYVGQTIQPLSRRWRDHQRQGACVRLSRAIQKYGAAAFSVEKLCGADSKLQLDMLERFWIEVHQATDRALGFNLRTGGSFGKHSDESRRKMSEKVRAAYERPEVRANLRASRLGKKHTPERVAKVAAALTGKRASEATRGVLSELRKDLWADQRYRDAVTAAQTAGKCTDEARQAAASKSKAQWADPEKRKKLLEAQAAGKARAKAARERR